MNRAYFLQVLAYSRLATVTGMPSFLLKTTLERSFLIEAHRGYSSQAPENTLPAIERALQSNADRIEIDLRLTRDHTLILMHDATVDRTTNGEGEVANTSYQELKKLDAGSWKNTSFSGIKIPTLEDVFDLCKNKRMLNIDLKVAEAVDPLVKLIKKWNFQDQIVVSGLIPVCVDRFRQNNMPLTMFYEVEEQVSRFITQHKILEAITDAIVSARSHYLPGFLFHSGWVTPEVVYAAHLHGLAVNTYAVDDYNTLKRMLTAKVDGVMTNDPGMIEHYLISS